MDRIMVMGTGGPAGLNFIRSLRLSNERYYIVGCDINKWHLELADVDMSYVVPPALADDYIDKINEIIESEEIDFLHAQPDIEVEIISENREKILTKTLLPSKETIRICRDKYITNSILRKKGIPAPYSEKVEKISDLKDLIEEIKKVSRQKKVWLRAVKGAGSKAALPVKSYRQAREWIHYWRATNKLETKDFMVSEFLPGKEYAFQSLWFKGELITSQARERIEYLFGNLFPSGQSSSPSIAKTVHNEHVNSIATKAVRAVDREATGVFCVDLKEDSQGTPCVTEINAGRFFTTSYFFSKLGSNMPDYYVKLGLNKPLEKLPKYNAIDADIYWIRTVDTSPICRREDELRCIEI